MDRGNISPEQESLVVVVGEFVDALLSEIFENDFLATEFVAVISCAVSSSSETVGLDEIVTTVHALPVHEVRGHEYFFTEFFVNFLEVLDEIENQIVIA
jgi:hypothetical protein